ncbi:Uncharacterised protein [Mycobacteroides abscessus subsp. abscessus]|nr:Uncharacterised protein [Mycobacteroides abscessus subsp. abscessus]
MLFGAQPHEVEAFGDHVVEVGDLVDLFQVPDERAQRGHDGRGPVDLLAGRVEADADPAVQLLPAGQVRADARDVVARGRQRLAQLVGDRHRHVAHRGVAGEVVLALEFQSAFALVTHPIGHVVDQHEEGGHVGVVESLQAAVEPGGGAVGLGDLEPHRGHRVGVGGDLGPSGAPAGPVQVGVGGEPRPGR